jgi:hypothetical protein
VKGEGIFAVLYSTYKLGDGHLTKNISLNLKKVECESVDFSHLELSGSSFSQMHATHCLFIGTHLKETDFIGAHFKNCDFVGAEMCRANFTRAHFTGCTLSHSDLQGSYLSEACFKETDLMGAILFDCIIWSADLGGANHIKMSSFMDARPMSRHTQCRISEKDPYMACESYRSLKHHFYRRGLYEDGSWAAYKELTMERKHLFLIRSPRYFPSLLMDVLSGYTEKPHRVIMSSLGIVLLFGFAYHFLGALRSTVDAGSVPSMFDSVYFSFISFTTVGFGDLIPKAQWWVRGMVCLEAFSGPFMAGLYIFTLTRRYAAG